VLKILILVDMPPIFAMDYMNGNHNSRTGAGYAQIQRRYCIQPLELKHLEWTKALFAHSFVRLDWILGFPSIYMDISIHLASVQPPSPGTLCLPIYSLLYNND
jgi:hypothetical protein